jgi:hypothetical protein
MVHLIHLVGLVYGHFHLAQRGWQGVMSIGHRAGVTTVEYVRATTTSATIVSRCELGAEWNRIEYIAQVVACGGCKFCQSTMDSGRSDC